MFHSSTRKIAVSIIALTTILASTQSAFAALTIGATTIRSDGDFKSSGAAASVSEYADLNTTGNVTLGKALTTGTLVIGSATGTGAITVGASTGAGQTVNIGSGATTGSDIVNIGTGAATTLKTVNIGTVGSVVSASTVNISNTSDATGTQTVSVGSAAKAANVLTLEAGTAATAIQIGNGATAHGIQIGSNATAANAVKLGGAHASSVTTIEGGTAAGAILIGNGATAHGIQIGNGAAVNTVILGSTNTTSTLALNAGVDDTTGGITVTGAINGASPLSFEGSTANGFETTLAVTDPTADRTVTVPNAPGTMIFNNVEAEASTDTITVGQVYGTTITNTGAGGAVVLTLPTPAVGMEITFYLTAAADVDINAANGTQILALTNATGDAISSAATIGNFITLRAISATEWIALASSGTWTDVN